MKVTIVETRLLVEAPLYSSHLSPTAIFFGGQSIHSLMFHPLYNGHFLLFQRVPWETRAGSSLSLLTHAIQWVRTENEVCFPLWTCLSSPWIPVLQGQCVPYAMAAKPFWLAPLGLAQLSDLVLEGTSFSIKEQGTTVQWGLFHASFFFLTVGFSFIGAFWIALRRFPTLLV